MQWRKTAVHRQTIGMEFDKHRRTVRADPRRSADKALGGALRVANKGKRITIMRSQSLFALLLTVSASAFAQPPITITGNVPKASVSVADLNLHSASGQARQQSRINRAAETLCMDRAVRDIGRTASGLTCRDRAIASAEPQVFQLVQGNASPANLAAATITITVQP